MTEDQARQLVLLLSRESGEAGAAWTADDRAWATRQALAAVGESASPETFVTARTALALGRLLPRDPAARRFLERRVWQPAWVLLVMALGAAAGLLVDQLGPPQRVNLLAPAVWAVVAWNAVVYALLLWPRRSSPWAARLAAWVDVRTQGPALFWARHAAPLSAQRLLLLMHSAAAALALGLMAGLYLRGLVLDYRIGWQSTFLEASAVQSALQLLLAPASALTGVPVGDVVPLRLAPGAVASASAAPWIHLYAATLGLFVVLPRLLLAAWAAGRALRLSQRFPLPLDLPGLRSLHPLMRPGPPQPLRLLWDAPPDLAPLRLLDTPVSHLDPTLTLWASPDGDSVQLLSLPAQWSVAPAPGRRRWWARWARGDAAAESLERLQRQVDAVLRVVKTEAAPSPWLAALGRPVVTLLDADRADPPLLPLRRLADGWLADGALLQALHSALPDDDRVPRLAAAWQGLQAQRLDEAMALLGRRLAAWAARRVPVSDAGLLARRDDGAAALQALSDQLTAELSDTALQLARLLGRDPQPAGAAPSTARPTVQSRVPESRTALAGAAGGALLGLKADVLSGGLTLGLGALAGGVAGALGARGINAVRGSERSHAGWGEDAALPLAQALLVSYLQLAHGMEAEEAARRLRPGLGDEQAALQAGWHADSGEALAAILQRVLRRTLGGP